MNLLRALSSTTSHVEYFQWISHVFESFALSKKKTVEYFASHYFSEFHWKSRRFLVTVFAHQQAIAWKMDLFSLNHTFVINSGICSVVRKLCCLNWWWRRYKLCTTIIVASFIFSLEWHFSSRLHALVYYNVHTGTATIPVYVVICVRNYVYVRMLRVENIPVDREIV